MIVIQIEVTACLFIPLSSQKTSDNSMTFLFIIILGYILHNSPFNYLPNVFLSFQSILCYALLTTGLFRNLSVKNGDKPKNGHRAGTLSSMPQAPRRPRFCGRGRAERSARLPPQKGGPYPLTSFHWIWYRVKENSSRMREGALPAGERTRGGTADGNPGNGGLVVRG